MSEGGQFPWKTQKITSRGPTADYSQLKTPLPPPPAGLQWLQEGRDWRLVPVATTGVPELWEENPSSVPLIPAALVVEEDPSSHGAAAGAGGEEEWEILSSRLGSVRSLSSADNLSHTNSTISSRLSSNNNNNNIHGNLQQPPTPHYPFKIQRTTSSSTIDSSDHNQQGNLGPLGKGVLGVDYVEHVVLPTDTLQGICLAYKISTTRLRQANCFSGNSLVLAPKKLVIPISKQALRSGYIRVQDTDAKEYKLHALMAEYPSLSTTEAQAYMELANWVLSDAIRSAKEDQEWEQEMDGSSAKAGALKGGEIRITFNKAGRGPTASTAFRAHLQGAGIQKGRPKSSTSPTPQQNSLVETKVQAADNSYERQDEVMSKPTLTVYEATPAIANKDAKAKDLYNAVPQHEHFGVELKPLPAKC